MQTILLPKLVRRDGVIDRIAKVLSALPIDCAWKVQITKHSARSLSQNAYLWGCVYPTILREGGETLGGWTAQDLHDHFLGEFAGTEKLSAFGKTYDKPLSRSRTMSKAEFGEFTAFIQRYMAELGVFVPDPDPAYSSRRAA
jgi:hypothetical protein